MNSTEYQELALRTESPVTPELIERLTGNVRAIHAFFGLLTETGELADGFKRAIFYGKPLDTTNIAEEIGDIFWYQAILCDTLGIDFESCMVANIEKLRKRYPTKYSHESALNRDLEAEREALTTLETRIGSQYLANKTKCSTCNDTGKIESGPSLNTRSRPCPDCRIAKRKALMKLPKYNPSPAGWEDPVEYVAEPIDLTSNGMIGEATPFKVSVPAVPSVVCKKPLGHSYTRYCSICETQPIHKTNTVGICTSCYMKHRESKEGK